MPILPWITTTNSTGTAPMWVVPGATTATSTITEAVWLNQYQTTSATTAGSTTYFVVGQEDDRVEHRQYLALAMGRARAFRERTEQERIAEEAAYQFRVQAERERRLLREAAKVRSRELLLAHLTAAQRETFEKHKWFVVEGGVTKASYRIRTESYAGNIDVLDGEKIKHRLCVHCASDIPLHDHHLAQKLSLQYDESYFLSIANRQAA